MNIAINFTAIVLATLSLSISLVSIILVLAQKWSSHKIEWRPLKMEEAKEEVYEETSDEDLLEKALELNKKKKKKEEDPLSDISSSNF